MENEFFSWTTLTWPGSTIILKQALTAYKDEKGKTHKKQFTSYFPQPFPRFLWALSLYTSTIHRSKYPISNIQFIIHCQDFPYIPPPQCCLSHSCRVTKERKLKQGKDKTGTPHSSYPDLVSFLRSFRSSTFSHIALFCGTSHPYYSTATGSVSIDVSVVLAPLFACPSRCFTICLLSLFLFLFS